MLKLYIELESKIRKKDHWIFGKRHNWRNDNIPRQGLNKNIQNK